MRGFFGAKNMAKTEAKVRLGKRKMCLGLALALSFIFNDLRGG
jgi:hypothetical protein